MRILSFLICGLFCMQSVAQKKLSIGFIMQPGNSFISGKWENFSTLIFPTPFKRNITPSIEAGVEAVLSTKGKVGKKVVYDEMVKSGFYLVDRVAFGLGMFYSIGGQNYRDMSMIDLTWSRKVRLRYWKIPLQVYFIRGKETKNQIIYTVGVYGGYLTYYKEMNGLARDNSHYEVVATENSLIKTNTILGSSSISNQYEWKSKPYNSRDYGATIGVGLQKNLNPDCTIQLMLFTQRGFADIINKEAQYTDGPDSYTYFDDNKNIFLSHSNTSISLRFGLVKHFE